MTTLLFASAGRERALALGFMTSQRNMGLMVAATGGALPDMTWLYFAVCQFPIYFSPQLLKPFVARLHFIEMRKKAAAKDQAENDLLGMNQIKYVTDTIQHQTAKLWSAEIRERDFPLASAAAVVRGDGIIDVTPDGIKAAQT